jgi:hypothetical protein
MDQNCPVDPLRYLQLSWPIPPNLTPDVRTGLGSWSEDEIVIALREGRTPDGHILRPPMPMPLYRSISDNDAHAIVTYLKEFDARGAKRP